MSPNPIATRMAPITSGVFSRIRSVTFGTKGSAATMRTAFTAKTRPMVDGEMPSWSMCSGSAASNWR